MEGGGRNDIFPPFKHCGIHSFHNRSISVFLQNKANHINIKSDFSNAILHGKFTWMPHLDCNLVHTYLDVSSIELSGTYFSVNMPRTVLGRAPMVMRTHGQLPK